MSVRGHCVGLILACGVLAFIQNAATHELADYPSFHCFERPTHAHIHRAFYDGEGNLILATGDWDETYWQPGLLVNYYWSTGVFRIDEEEEEALDCPSGTFVLDAAVDTDMRTWVLYGMGRDHITSDVSVPESAPNDYVWTGPHHGYRPWFYPLYDVTDRKVGLLTSGSLVEVPTITSAIPGEPIRLNSDQAGRKFMVSKAETASTDSGCDYFLSWWDDDASSLHTVNLSASGFVAQYIYGFPSFGPDGRVYVHSSGPECTGETALISIDTESFAWRVYRDTDLPLVSSHIEYFYIDGLGTMWFSTQNGLLRFDGQTWTTCSTANTGLPYNMVVQMAYDEVDDLYYVVTRQDCGGGYESAFSVFTPGGRLVGGPLFFAATQYPWNTPIICYDGRHAWWLCPFNTHAVYSYDHDRVTEWDVGDWIHPDALVGYIGSTSSGRGFCVAGSSSRPKCVMIW